MAAPIGAGRSLTLFTTRPVERASQPALVPILITGLFWLLSLRSCFLSIVAGHWIIGTCQASNLRHGGEGRPFYWFAFLLVVLSTHRGSGQASDSFHKTDWKESVQFKTISLQAASPELHEDLVSQSSTVLSRSIFCSVCGSGGVGAVHWTIWGASLCGCTMFPPGLMERSSPERDSPTDRADCFLWLWIEGSILLQHCWIL